MMGLMVTKMMLMLKMMVLTDSDKDDDDLPRLHLVDCLPAPFQARPELGELRLVHLPCDQDDLWSEWRWARWEWQQKKLLQSCSSQDLPTSMLERIFTPMRTKIEHWWVNNLEAAHHKENIVTCKLRSCSWETISWWSTPAVGEPSSMWAAQLRRRRTRKVIGGIFSFSRWVVHTAQKKLDYWRLSRACNDLILSMFNKSSLSLSLSNIVAIGYTRNVSLRKDVPFLHKYDNSRV